MNDAISLRGFDKEQRDRIKEEARRVIGKASINAFIHHLIDEHFKSNYNNGLKNNESKNNNLPYEMNFNSKKRFEISIYESDLLNIKHLANINKCSPSNYVISLVRNHLYNSFELTGVEVEILRNSNYQITSIGNNLNQISKRVNIGIGIDQHDIKLIKEVSLKIDDHVKFVNNVLRFNLNRW